VRDALYVVGGLAIVVFFIVRQLRSDRFEQRSLIFPIGLGIYGAVILNGTSKHHPSPRHFANPTEIRAFA